MTPIALNEIKSPCKDCDKKGCGAYHSECEAYKSYTQALEQYRESKNKWLENNRGTYKVVQAVNNKIKRNSRGRD